MNRPLITEPEARQELEDAAWWYEQQRPDLGGRFLKAVAATLDRIVRFPKAGASVPYAPSELGARRALSSMSAEEIEAAIAKAPDRIDDPECPYDPNDAAAVEAFWKNSTVRRPGQRGPAENPKKGPALDLFDGAHEMDIRPRRA